MVFLFCISSALVLVTHGHLRYEIYESKVLKSQTPVDTRRFQHMVESANETNLHRVESANESNTANETILHRVELANTSNASNETILASPPDSSHTSTNTVGRTGSETRLYVAVLTSPWGKERRYAVRNTWKIDADRHPNLTKVEFIICVHGVEEPVLQEMHEENALYKDIAMLECFEGYGEGHLTRKVFAAMQHFDDLESGDNVAFMKIDDDTFMRVDETLKIVAKTSSTAENYYMGYIYPSGPASRNASSKFFEPVEVWPGKYPASMSGAGYILNRGLVHKWCTDDLTAVRNRMLWNEDRAVGVWVNYEMVQKKVPITFVGLNIYGAGGPDSRIPGGAGRRRVPRGPAHLFHQLAPSQMLCVWKAFTRSDNLQACYEDR